MTGRWRVTLCSPSHCNVEVPGPCRDDRDDCDRDDPELVPFAGIHFHIPDEADRLALLRALA